MRLLLISFILRLSSALKYPNEIVDTPIVVCEKDRIIIKIKTTTSNPSHIYVDGRESDEECGTRNLNRIEVAHGKCGMINDSTEQPNGSIKRLCITVQLHPLFVTESDRSYCAQCVYIESHVMKDIESSLDISDSPPTQLSPQFDSMSMPKCSYTIRKESKDGPVTQYAAIGDSVFHVWSCDGDYNEILVQNCHVEDGQGNRILIIDQNGCGIDHYVMPTPEYTSNKKIAYQETHVFKFAQKTITRFICQLRICMKGDYCKRLSPPDSCPSLEERLNQTPKAHGVRNVVHASGHPTIDQGSTSKGTIYYGVGYNPKRNRREILIDNKPRPSFVVKNGYPELEMVGELRVLETPEDAEYFSRSSNCATTPSSNNLFFTVLLAVFLILTIILIAIFLLISSRLKSRKNNSLHFAQ
ncbi:unnamed protein product [Caenorhabditis bovis]|uniref:ZP domain-containing protein n=1 Tax=Caenorhabditis bovis TaxID=2654633 RepID=A0A8S1EU16_9PELO|nr:unnamed protein product [Caenorhabditis bovis]